jgi:hypothetical protein
LTLNGLHGAISQKIILFKSPSEQSLYPIMALSGDFNSFEARREREIETKIGESSERQNILEGGEEKIFLFLRFRGSSCYRYV